MQYPHLLKQIFIPQAKTAMRTIIRISTLHIMAKL